VFFGRKNVAFFVQFYSYFFFFYLWFVVELSRLSDGAQKNKRNVRTIKKKVDLSR